MPFDSFIQRVSVEAFRGFRDKCDFDVSGSAVLFSGPNGTGKTSFFDAIQWALAGRLERLENLRSRRNVEHVVNLWREGERATVELDLLVSDALLELRRRGDHAESTLELSIDGASAVFAEEAERQLTEALGTSPGVSIEMALMTSGMMQQDVMRQILEAKPSERYAHISSVLGLGLLEDFEEQAGDVAKTASSRVSTARQERDNAARRVEQAIMQKEQIERRTRSRPTVEAMSQRAISLAESAPEGLSVTLDDRLISGEAVAATLSDLSSFHEAFERLVTEHESINEIQGQLAHRLEQDAIGNLAASVEHASKEVDTALAELAQRQRELELAEASTEEVARLAASAIPLLSESCPVCGQAIDPEHVAEELRMRAEGSDQLMALRRRTDEAGELLTHARELHRSTESALAEARDSVRRWAEFDERVNSFIRDKKALSRPTGPVRVIDLDRVLTRGERTVEFLGELESSLIELGDLYETGPDSGLLERTIAEIESFEAALGEREERLAELTARAARASRLIEAAKQARQEVTRERIEAILPLVADIYSRLDPHPVFKTVELELDTYYRQGTTTPLVKDVLEGVSADPLVVMSTSQANIMALAYFLAMGWVAGERGLPFVLLDDPLQSMDDVNVLGFSDLFRHLRTRRQLLVSTHERRFASLLLRKLAPRDFQEQTIHFRFLGWDRSGPTFEREEIEPELIDQPNLLIEQAS